MFSTFLKTPSARRSASRLLVMVAMFVMPFAAMAAGGEASLPFEGPLTALKESLTGPVALAISVIGVVAAGAMLIFGGDMNGFMRSLVFLVLVIALIVGASSMLDTLFPDAGAVIATAQATTSQGIC